MLISPLPNSGRVPNGLGKLLMVKSQMKPARLLRMPNNAMKTTIWLNSEALRSGLNTTRSIATPAAKEMAMVRKKATQYGMPHCISCQAMKVENIAISPCAKLRLSIAW